MKKIDKKFFIHSFLLHILLIIFVLIFNSSNKITRRFIVFGVHSKKHTYAYFQPLKQATRSDWLKIRNATQKKPAQKKKTQVKKKVMPKKKPAIKKIVKKQPRKKVIIKPTKKTVVKKEEKKVEQEKQKPLKKEKSPQQEELHFNLMGKQNPKLAVYQKYIQKAVDRLWRPPIGVPKGTECILSCIIDSNGKVSRFEVIKQSKILIYDLSVLRIAKDLEPHKCLWNKKFPIVFRQ